MYLLQAQVDNVYKKPATTVNGNNYPESYMYQLSSVHQVDGEDRIFRIDVKAPTEFGKIPGCVGKELIFPVHIGQWNGKLTTRMADGATQKDVRMVPASKP